MNTCYYIIDAKSTILLEEKMTRFNISILGSLTIQNMHYYQAFIGVLKEVEVLEEKPKVTKDTPVIPETPKTPKAPEARVLDDKIPAKPKKRKSRAKKKESKDA